MDRGFSKRKRYTALAAKVFGCSGYSVRQRDVNRFVSVVDHRLTELRSHRIWSSEISDILGSKIWRKAGHEHRCAHNLGVSGCMMDQWVTGRRHIGRIEF